MSFTSGHSPELDDTPPDGEYGWLCVAACFLINFSTWGAVAVGQYQP